MRRTLAEDMAQVWRLPLLAHRCFGSIAPAQAYAQRVTPPSDDDGIPRILVTGALFSLLVLGVIIGVALNVRGGPPEPPDARPAAARVPREVQRTVVLRVRPVDGAGKTLAPARGRGIDVSFATVRRVNGRPVPDRRVLSARTDGRGEIRLVGVRPGAYMAVGPQGAFTPVRIPRAGRAAVPVCVARCPAP